MVNAVTEFRLKLQADGLHPIPARGKETFLPGWNRPHTAEEIKEWEEHYPQATNSGMRTCNAPTLDSDILIPEAANAVEEFLRDQYDGCGTLLVRIGHFPKRAFPFRTRTPFPKIRADYIAPNGSKHHVEFLGDGQQVIVDGIHPDTKKPYHWHGDYRPGEVPRENWIEIDEAEARALVEQVSDMLHAEFGFTRVAPGNGHDHAADTGAKPPVDVEQELADIHFGNIHNTWGRCMGSLLRAGMPANDIFRRLLTATAESPACQADPKRTLWPQGLAKMLTGYLHDDMTFVAALPPKQQSDWHQRRAEGWAPRVVWRAEYGLQVRREKGQAGDEPRQEHEREHEEHEHEKPKGKIGWPTPYTGRAAAQIPLRSFVLGQHYLIGATSVTASAGGTGKSTLSLVDAISFNVGRNLLTGEVLERRRRVWVWNAEDDIDEMERRVVGICSHYNINRTDLDGWLFLDSGYDLPLDLAQGNGKGTIIQEGLIDLIAARVKELEIEVVMLDRW